MTEEKPPCSLLTRASKSLRTLPPLLFFSDALSREQFENYVTGVEDIVSRATQLNYFEHLGDYVTEVTPPPYDSLTSHLGLPPELCESRQGYS
jgi:hypothetical protein